MKKRNKIFTKLLCIALVCVMLVTSMGAYSGVVAADKIEIVLSATEMIDCSDYSFMSSILGGPNNDVKTSEQNMAMKATIILN